MTDKLSQALNRETPFKLHSGLAVMDRAPEVFKDNLFVPQPKRWTYPSGRSMGLNLPSYTPNHFDIGRDKTDEIMEDLVSLEIVTIAAGRENYVALHYIYHKLVFDFLCELHWKKFTRVKDPTTWRELTILFRNSTSKLSQDELIQLQKETHFDKKELQQWYKG